MTGQTAAEHGRAEELAELHDPLASSFPPSLTGRFLFWLAVAFSLYQMTRITLQMDSTLIIVSGFVQGLGIGFTFVPLSTATFATLAPRLRNQGTPIFSERAVPVKLPRHRVQDIDTPEDWHRAEWLFKAWQAQQKGGEA